MKERLEGLARAAARRPVLTIAIVVAAAIAGGILALGLKPSTGTDTFVSSSSASYRATADDHRHFGGDAVDRADPGTADRPRRDQGPGHDHVPRGVPGRAVRRAEPALQAFQPAPPGAHAPYGGCASPCGKLMRYKPVQVVYGPGTFLNRAVAAVNARDPVAAQVRPAADHERRQARREAGPRARPEPRAGAGGGQVRRRARAASNSSNSSSSWPQLGDHRRAADRRSAVHPERSCSTTAVA